MAPTPRPTGRAPEITARAPAWAIALLAGVLLWSLGTDLRSVVDNAPGWSWGLALLVLKVIIDHGSLVLAGVRPYAAAVALWISLPITVTSGHIGTTLLSVPGVTAAVLALCRPRFAALHLAVCAGWVVAHAASGTDPMIGWTLVLFLVPAVTGGLVTRWFLVRVARERERSRRAAALAAGVREQERLALSRELHDVVASSLALISLETSGVEDSEDPAELRQALGTVQQTSRAAAAELRLLVRTLREPPGDPGQVAPAESQRAGSLAEVTQQAVHTLVEHGFAVATELGDFADIRVEVLQPSVVHTYLRIIREAVTNVIKHAPPGAGCTVTGILDGCQLSVRVANQTDPQAEAVAARSDGVGLKGIAERAMLISGTVSYGMDDGQWVVSASLPLRP
ncbi:MAG: histidine kinase [Propionicimonas sp.]